MKRFYRTADSAARDGGFGMTLDGKWVKTPGGAPLLVPTAALAAALAEEWRLQGPVIQPASMPLTQLANTAIDRVEPNSLPIWSWIAGFAATDLLCYRALHPADLADRQAEAWQPWLDWVADRFQAPLLVTKGVVPVAQPLASLDRLRAHLAKLDPWTLSALNLLVPALGSLVLSLALTEGQLLAGEAFELAHLDEAFQAERWGQDPEALARQDARRREIAAAARFLTLLGAKEMSD